MKTAFVVFILVASLFITACPSALADGQVILEDHFSGSSGDPIAGRTPDTSGYNRYTDPQEAGWNLWLDGHVGHSLPGKTFAPFLYDVGTGNMILEAELFPEKSNFSPGVVFRSNAEGTDFFYVSCHWDWDQMRYELRHYHHGELTVLAWWYDSAGLPDVWHKIRIEAFCTRITVSVDGITRIEYTDMDHLKYRHIGATSGDYWNTLMMRSLKASIYRAYLPVAGR